MVEEVFLSSFCIPRCCTKGLSAKYSEIGFWGFGFSCQVQVWFGNFCEYLADNIPIITYNMYFFYNIPHTRVSQYYTYAPSSWFLTTRHLPGGWAGATGGGRRGHRHFQYTTTGGCSTRCSLTPPGGAPPRRCRYCPYGHMTPNPPPQDIFINGDPADFLSGDGHQNPPPHPDCWDPHREFFYRCRDPYRPGLGKVPAVGGLIQEFPTEGGYREFFPRASTEGGSYRKFHNGIFQDQPCMWNYIYIITMACAGL